MDPETFITRLRHDLFRKCKQFCLYVLMMVSAPEAAPSIYNQAKNKVLGDYLPYGAASPSRPEAAALASTRRWNNGSKTDLSS